MQHIKAIFAGISFIVVVGMVLQLVAIFIAVGYIQLAKLWPFLDQIGFIFRYILAIPSFLLVLFMGGYITAMVAKAQVYADCLLVGVITVGLSVVAALNYLQLTALGMVLTVLAVLVVLAGGDYQQRRQRAAQG